MTKLEKLYNTIQNLKELDLGNALDPNRKSKF